MACRACSPKKSHLEGLGCTRDLPCMRDLFGRGHVETLWLHRLRGCVWPCLLPCLHVPPDSFRVQGYRSCDDPILQACTHPTHHDPIFLAGT